MSPYSSCIWRIVVSLCAASYRKISPSKNVSEGKDVLSQSESGGKGSRISHGRKTDGGDYLGCVFGLVVPVQELDMFGNDVVRILVLASKSR